MEYTPQLGIGYAVQWWLLLQIFGLIALPAAWRLFRHLPDCGYALARPLGLIGINCLLWMLSTLGLLQNTWSGIVSVILLTLAVSVFLYRRQSDRLALLHWLREQRTLILVSEAVFTAAFVLWVAYKAYDPDIAITEKPMEFALLNAIMRSERFPAYDPWMSGYGISYYHFGYIMVASLAKLGRIPTNYAFNLGTVTLFALTATGAFSVVYNMVHVAATRRRPGSAMRLALAYGALAALIIPLMSNLEGALEYLHANGVGVTVNEPGNVTGPFWEWIDVYNLNENGTLSETWYPTDGWWWWRASRVIGDKSLVGGHMEIISEFPAFSFLLGDMHPHVLAYPFVFLVLGLALNLLLAPEPPSAVTWGGVYLCLGAIGFLNTWDMPFYFFILVAAYALNCYLHPQVGAPSLVERALGRVGAFGPLWLRRSLFRAVEMAVAAALLYLPYWIYGRPAAAAGILPNLFNVTRFAHLFLMFGPFLLVLAVLLGVLLVDLWRTRQATRQTLLRQGLPIWLVTMFAFPVLLAVVLIPALVLPSVRTYIDDVLESPDVQQFLGPQTLGSLLRISLRIRLGLLPDSLRQIRMPAGPWTFLILSLLIAAIVFWFLRAVLSRGAGTTDPESQAPGPSGSRPARPSPALQFALLMAFTGLLLVFGVEFVYLRDPFGTRMNTIFKFYFQAWALLGLTACFGAYELLDGRPSEGMETIVGRIGRAALNMVLAVMVLAGLLYPLGMSINRSGGFAGPATLDGTAFVARSRPDEWAVVQWLNQNTPGNPVIVEAVGGSFAYEHARISSRTGLPAVMGWTGHENTWHGLGQEIAEREGDVRRLYAGGQSDAQFVIDKYDVRYVIVGYLERQEFGSGVDKFGRFMDVAFQAGDTIVYQTR